MQNFTSYLINLLRDKIEYYGFAKMCKRSYPALKSISKKKAQTHNTFTHAYIKKIRRNKSTKKQGMPSCWPNVRLSAYRTEQPSGKLRFRM